MKRFITFILVLFAGISAARAQYYIQPYYDDNKLRFYPIANPVAGSPFYTLDLSADVLNAWGENTSGPNDVLVYNNKVFVSFDLGDRGGVLIYNLSDIYPTRTANAPIVVKPQTANGLSTAGMAINPATGDLFIGTTNDGNGDSGVYQYTAASGYVTGTQFASYDNDNSVAQVCANLAFDAGGNMWMTTWEEDDNATDHFLICYKGLNKNNFYKITNTATASYSGKDASGTNHTGLNLLSAPEGIAFDASGNLYLSNNNDFALTNPAGAGTLVKFNASWLTTLLAGTATGEGGPSYTVPAAQATIMYISGGKLGGQTFNGNTLYVNDQGQNQGDDYTSSGTVWQWDVTTVFNTTNFKASGIHTTYPGNGGGALVTLAKSTDATLSALSLSSGTLSPVFAAATTSYTATVANAVSSVTITPTSTNAAATIKVNGTAVTSGTPSAAIPLTVGSNTITTVVTAQDGVTTKTYTVTVTRSAASSNANLSALVISSGTLSPGFTAATTSYTASVANTVSSITVTPTSSDAGATIKVNGTAVASGVASAAIALAAGSNTITTVVTAADGVTTKTYTVTVTRAAAAGGTLYYCQPYYTDNKLRFYTTTNPVASSPFYTLDVSADVNKAWGETVAGPNDVVVYNNKVFVSFDLGDRGGVLIYNLSDIYPARTANAPIVIKPQTTNGLSTTGIAINPANGDLYVPTIYDGTDDAGVYQYTAASGYTTVSQFASYFNDSSVAQVCANLAFDAGGNMWMTTWDENDNANAHFLICYKGLNKNNYYKVTNTATATYSATDASGATHNSLNLLSAPEGIAFDVSGNLWLANNNDFALTNPAGAGTFVKVTASWLTTLLGSPTTGSSAGNPTYTVPAAQAAIMYVSGGKLGGLTFNGNVLYIPDQGQNQGTDYTASGTVWQWNVTTTFNTTNFKASGIHTTYPGNGGGAMVALPGDATLSALTISSGTLSPVFAAATTSYKASVGNSVTAITVTPTANTATSTIKVNGVTVASGVASGSLPLSVGANTITTVVTAQDGVTTKTYTVTVTRAPSTDAYLSNLKVTTATLSPTFAFKTLSYTSSVSNATSSVTVTPTLLDATATVKVNGTAVANKTASGAIALNVGSNTITVLVTAQDGKTTETYTVTITRAASTNASLAGLKLSSGSLTPAFATGTTSYTSSVGNGTTSITVTPTTAVSTATVTVNGTTTTSGTASAAIALNVGSNTITTIVTAQDGVTTKTYTVTVTRAASTDAYLSSLKVTTATLSPTFAFKTLAYTSSVPNATSSVTLTPTLLDATATVKVNGTAVANKAASGAIALAVGSNTITAVVTAQDGVTTETYTVTITRAAGGADTYNPDISVTKPTETPTLANDGILVHQAVSPNGDGINDFLQIDNITNYPENRLAIMNRNGQLIYEANGYDNDSKVFDGHSNKNGQMQLPGTYFYQLDYTVAGITKHKTGFIVLKY